MNERTEGRKDNPKQYNTIPPGYNKMNKETRFNYQEILFSSNTFYLETTQ